jgi:hypothetical protein
MGEDPDAPATVRVDHRLWARDTVEHADAADPETMINGKRTPS